ncbi:MAG: PCMD domain-containing protein [bacterium]
MKQMILLFLTGCLIQIGFSQSVLPNGDFENWYHEGTAPNNYMQPGDSIPFGQLNTNFWQTLNELASLPFPIGPGPITVFRTDERYSGLWAAKLVSDHFYVPPTDIFIPGMLGTTKLDMLYSTIRLGKPCPGCKPLNLRGYYMFQPVNGDSCTALLAVTKWNSTTNFRDTIGYGRIDFKDTVSTYTAFDVPIVYYNNFVPDTMTILLVSSGGFSVSDLQGGTGQIGSTMWVDDVTVDYPAGITQVLMPEVGVKIYPNPATETIQFALSHELDNGRIEIFSTEGKFIDSFPVNGVTISFMVTKLANGTYYYKLTDGKTMVNSGFFLVQK